MLPSPDILNEFPQGKFVLSNLAAKRAKQLREGAPPLVQVDSNHPLTIALAEIAAGKIKAIMPTTIDAIRSNAVDLPILVDESELGMLLPALDEVEVAMVSEVGEEDADPEHDGEDGDAMSLADLVGGEDEEVTPVAGEEDTLSLSDIAEQETTLEDDEPEE